MVPVFIRSTGILINTAGFVLTPSWLLLETFFGLQITKAAIPLKKGGNPIFVPTNPHGPFSKFRNVGFKRCYRPFRAYK